MDTEKDAAFETNKRKKEKVDASSDDEEISPAREVPVDVMNVNADGSVSINKKTQQILNDIGS